MSSLAVTPPDMGKSSEHLPYISLTSYEGAVLVSTLLGLSVTSIRYAMWLNTPTGRKWDEQHTWFVTVIGVFLTLGWLALHDPRAAIKAFAFFVVSGTPIVVRALANNSATLETYINESSRESI